MWVGWGGGSERAVLSYFLSCNIVEDELSSSKCMYIIQALVSCISSDTFLIHGMEDDFVFLF